MSERLSLAMVAGEASSDLLGGLLLQGLRQRWPQVQAGGIGGPRMVAEGFQAWAPADRLSVFGYVDALARLPELLALRRRTALRIEHERPDVFVGIDAPDFNFGLEKRLRRAGLKTVHFVCPSIWAWRPQRVHTLREAADHVLCLFPFEPDLLTPHGVNATFVGHPLADVLPLEVPRAQARAHLGLPAEAEVLALLPGSRLSEVRLIGPTLVEAAQRLLVQRPGLRLVLPAAPSVAAEVQRVFAPLLATGRLLCVQGQSHAALAAADQCWVASGTATLEAALLKCPMVVVYRVSALNWWRMKGQALQPWVSLPNILSQRHWVPELLQDALQPQALLAASQAWWGDAPRREAFANEALALHEQLRQDTAQRAGQALARVLAA